MTFRQPQRVQTSPKKRRHKPFKLFVVVALLVVLSGSAVYALHHTSKQPTAQSKSTAASSQKTSTSHIASTPPAPAAKNYCAGNTLSELVLVSISKQHLWACSGSTVEYNSAVVTGMEQYPADLTPVGTYHIYAKETNLHLKGCDSTGCWDDPVSYWMPWLDNQYGQYGFHDATWRTPSEFGNVNIYAPDTAAVIGSHGCVELPLATAKWLYSWTSVGTTVTIES